MRTTRTSRSPQDGGCARRQDEILQFLSSWHDQALYGGSAQARDIDRGQGLHGMWSRGGYRESDHFSGQWSVKGWPGTKPDHIDERGRLLSSGGNPSAGVVRCSQGIAIDLVHVSDVSGLVELGEVELTVTRESTANTRAALAERIAADIQPEVLAATNALGDYGMLPGRVRFIRGLAQTYGPEVLEKTTLQWIPLTIPPGDLVHQSREQVARHLAGQDQLLVAVGASPGGVYSHAGHLIPISELGKMVVLATSIEEAKADYQRRDKLDHDGHDGLLQGELDHVLEEGGLNEKELVLLSFFLKCIAEAWNMSESGLRDQTWRLEYRSDFLWARLVRPK